MNSVNTQLEPMEVVGDFFSLGLAHIPEEERERENGIVIDNGKRVLITKDVDGIDLIIPIDSINSVTTGYDKYGDSYYTANYGKNVVVSINAYQYSYLSKLNINIFNYSSEESYRMTKDEATGILKVDESGKTYIIPAEHISCIRKIHFKAEDDSLIESFIAEQKSGLLHGNIARGRVQVTSQEATALKTMGVPLIDDTKANIIVSSSMPDISPVTMPYSPMPRNIYGKGIEIYPHVPSKLGDNYLEKLLPLEEYDYIFVLMSGGKDSNAVLLYLLYMGVPVDKIILMHHCIDGKGENKVLEMDWACTKDYCIKLAKHFGIKIRFSWREGGFGSELFRVGASAPVSYEDINTGNIVTAESESWVKSVELKAKLEALSESSDDTEVENVLNQLKGYGYRFKFPAKTASLKQRWCSSALKIEVFDKFLRHCESINQNKKILVCDGIRREESPNRSRYNEMELHTTNAPTKQRIIHLWRPIADWEERLVWAIHKMYGIMPNIPYFLGYSRLSCCACIFSLPHHLAGLRELEPRKFNRIVELEKQLNFTVDNKKDLLSFVGDTRSCVPENADINLLNIIRTGVVPDDYISVSPSEWTLPVGAYHGHEGGAC